MSEPATQEPFERNQSYPEIDSFLAALPDKDGALIPVLHHAQETYGFLSKDVQLYVARKLGLPAAKVYGVATFYSLFSMEKKGRYAVKVCLGTACFVRGAEAVVKEFEKELDVKVTHNTKDGLFALDTIRCVGACGLAPVVMVGERVYGRVTPKDVKGIVDEYLGRDGEAE